MKTKLFTTVLAAGFAIGVQAQTTFFSGFENWGTSASTFTASPTSPTDWMGSKTTASIVVSQVTTGAEQGSLALNVVNTPTTAVRLTTQPVAITQGMAYQVSYYAKGKGSVRAGLFSGKLDDAGFGYTYATYQSISSPSWHKYSQSLVADTTNGSAQFILGFKSTGTYTNSTTTIVGLDIDSVSITPYTIQPVSLHDIQFTNVISGATAGYSPYYGKIVTTAGIVTAVYNGSSGTQTGFYMQNNSSNNWSAILVYDYAVSNHVAIGDSVIATGNVDEYYSSGGTMTELSNVDSVHFQIVSHGQPVPAPTALSTTAMNDEQYEAILVTTQSPATCATFTTSYGQGSIDDGSGAIEVDKQIYAFTYVVGSVYKVTGPINWNYGFNIEPRNANDIVTITGIEKHNTLNALIYPNPIANELNIQLPVVAEKINVSITDIMGREMMAPVLASGISVSVKDLNLAPGAYVVKITADGNTQLAKIIKQ